MSSLYWNRVRIVVGFFALIGAPMVLEGSGASLADSSRTMIIGGAMLVGFALIMSAGGL